ncbi:hypothetical protein [Flavobacterium sp.]|uniref:hypothetical protein n=1 Tax=Flavobacterium sp. TaxID=239 RepID=UPI003D2C175C
MRKINQIILIVFCLSIFTSFTKHENIDSKPKKLFRAYFFTKTKWEGNGKWACHYTAGLIIQSECLEDESDYGLSTSYALDRMNNKIKYTPGGNYNKNDVTFSWTYTSEQKALDWLWKNYDELEEKADCVPDFHWWKVNEHERFCE